MQFDEKIKTAFEVLRNAAENDFERHRIDVLERDLTSPPVAVQVDEKHQRFDGITYTKLGHGYFRGSPFIHQAVWHYYHGSIPEGYDIHHDNENKADNSIGNLICLTKSEHHRIHMLSGNGIKMRGAIKKRTFICANCGKEFLAFPGKTGKKGSRFCSQKCWAAYNRASYSEIRTCENCGRRFSAYKYGDQKCCSHSCAASLVKKTLVNKVCPVCGNSFAASNQQIYCSQKCCMKANNECNMETRICQICGKEFRTLKSRPTRTCSKNCASKLTWQIRGKTNKEDAQPELPFSDSDSLPAAPKE